MAAEEGVKSVATNRRAGFDYELGTRYEAGIALSGGEIKSVRAGRMDLRDAFVIIRQGSAFLVNAYIPSYTLATGFNAGKIAPAPTSSFTRPGSFAAAAFAWAMTSGSAAFASRICISCVSVGRAVEP